MNRCLRWVPRALGHPLNILLGLVLLVVLVLLPLVGVHVPDGAELVGGNVMNGVGYLGASIAAGASVTNLREHRAHRRHVLERLTALHTHLNTAPRGDNTLKETAP